MSDPADLPLELAERPTFTEPWHATAFALAVQLHAGGAFAWPELATELGTRIAADPAGEYYEHWLAAVETLVVRHGVATGAEIDEITDAWLDAAARTPHGRPILLHGIRER
jgi:nitrile hydratase accessory protein